MALRGGVPVGVSAVEQVGGRIEAGELIDEVLVAWYGLERGASLAGLAATVTAKGVTTGSAFPVSAAWLGTWLRRNPS